MPTSPTAPTAVPDFPAIGDASYNTKAYNWATHMDATYPAEMLALATNTYNNAVEADADATTATTKAAEAVAAASAATATANASAWVNGGTYALNANAISGVDFQTYRKKTASSVTVTDPSADGANWVQVGGSTIGTGGTTSTASITLTASSAAAMTVTPATPGLYVTLPDATTCTKADNLYSVYNAGDYDYGVKDSAGTQLGWIRARTGAMIGLADNSTAAGVWAYYGLEKTGITASYVNSTLTNMGSTIRRIALDSDRTCFLFGGVGCYAIVYDASTQTWGSATLVRASVANGAFLGVLAATDKVLVVSNDSTTGMEAVTLTIATNTITVNTGTKATATLGGTWNAYGQLVAVGAAWVVSYTHTSTGYLRAITVSGTTPTIGAQKTPTVASASPLMLFVSGSVLRTIGAQAGQFYCEPFTLSGTTLTGGTYTNAPYTTATFRAFLNGNGNIVCHYINTTHYATIFKLTGTVEAASSVSLGTVPADVTNHADYVQVTASKTAFVADASSTTWYANILTDTSGTASAGTQISGAHATLSYGVAGITTSGDIARFCLAGSTAIGQITLDCSGASPVLSAQSSNVAATGANAAYKASDIYGSRNGQSILADTTGYGIGGTGSSFYDMRFMPLKVVRSESISMPTGASFISGASNESFSVGVANSTTGIFIQRIEAAA